MFATEQKAKVYYLPYMEWPQTTAEYIRMALVVWAFHIWKVILFAFCSVANIMQSPVATDTANCSDLAKNPESGNVN